MLLRFLANRLNYFLMHRVKLQDCDFPSRKTSGLPEMKRSGIGTLSVLTKPYGGSKLRWEGLTIICPHLRHKSMNNVVAKVCRTLNCPLCCHGGSIRTSYKIFPLKGNRWEWDTMRWYLAIMEGPKISGHSSQVHSALAAAYCSFTQSIKSLRVWRYIPEEYIWALFISKQY